MKTALAVTLMNLRSLGGRLGASLVIVVGIAFVVAVLVSMLSMSQGFDRTLRGTGTDARAILLSGGITTEISSTLTGDIVPLLRELPGIRRDADDEPLASAEVMVITELKRGEGAQRVSVNVALRGVEPIGIRMRPELKIVEGRMFTPGLRELIAGKGAQQQFEGIAVGKALQFRGSEWIVSGIFSSEGDAHESELWTDAATARSAFGRGNAASSMLVQLEPGALRTLTDAITTDPRFRVDVMTERAYFASQSEDFTNRIGVVTNIVAAIMAIGALFGALNTMYSAVSARQVEIATLRAIGFGGMPVAVSVLVEAVLLAVTGGLIGSVLSWALFNGYSVSTLGSNFTQVAFSFAVTPELIATGLVWAVFIGFIGGLFPAMRAARLPIVDALRAT